MLKVLLRVTSGVLKTVPPPERHRSLGGRLAQPIFQVRPFVFTSLRKKTISEKNIDIKFSIHCKMQA